MNQGFVYIIHAVGTNRIKIGFTADLKRRLKALQTAAPYPLQMLASWPGTEARERRVHRYLSQFRKVGEWFEVPPFTVGYQIWQLVTQGEVTGEFRQFVKSRSVYRDGDFGQISESDRLWLDSADYEQLTAYDPRIWRIERSGHNRGMETFKQVLRFVSPRVFIFHDSLTPALSDAISSRPGRGRRRSAIAESKGNKALALAVAERIYKYRSRKGSR